MSPNLSRLKLSDANAAHWSHDWIMLPNPNYSFWEGAAFQFNWKASDEVKRQMKFDTMVD
jgi:acid phosphatase